ncbi:MAG: dTDP-4-dehydrorhamnose reductase [Candidatus Eisenbacteria bacterium]
MKILVTGGHGMLGQDLVPLLTQAGHDVRAPRHADAPLEEKGSLEVWLAGWTPEHVYHLAAYTDVDGCEMDEARARASNETATERVAALAFRWDASLTYVSTDYVFDGCARDPIPPQAHPAPINVYGRTKLLGEEAVRRIVARHWIVRVSWLCGPQGRNFVAAIQARIAAGQPLSVVDDQRGRPTFTFDLAPALVRLAEVAPPGIYHVANQGECTWYEFAAEILKRSGAPVPLKRMTTLELNRPARRPGYSVLDTTKADQALGGPFPTWQDALERYDRAIAARGAPHA